MEHMSFEDEDFIIRVRPGLDGEEWTGEIDISIISQGENPLNDEGYGQVMHFCKIFPDLLPLLEKEDKIFKEEQIRKTKLKRNKVNVDVTFNLDLEVDCIDAKQL